MSYSVACWKCGLTVDCNGSTKCWNCGAELELALGTTQRDMDAMIERDIERDPRVADEIRKRLRRNA